MNDGLASCLWPIDIGKLYGIGQDSDFPRPTVGVVAVGGGYDQRDIDAALKSMNRKADPVIPISINNVANKALSGSSTDKELALDLQVICGLLPTATVVVYFTGGNTDDLADAITYAAVNMQYRPSVLSISWGLREESWDFDVRQSVANALQVASDSQMSVVAASGDKLATDGDTSSQPAHVLFPACHPIVFSCGGTELDLSPGQKTVVDETVWNDPAAQEGSDGGISKIYGVPAYQQSAGLPVPINSRSPGRGVPDFAAAASKSPGYRIVLNGIEQPAYGTSAATPLWAAVIAMASAKRGRPLGDFHQYLYDTPGICRQITNGDNRVNGVGYYATPGARWNACTGLGVPKGEDTIKALASMP